MSRFAKDKNERAPKPVEKVELSEKHVALRIFLFLLLLAIGIGAIMYGIRQITGGSKGWNTISVSSGYGTTCGGDFDFKYDLDGSTAQRKALTTAYSLACQEAYHLFSASESIDGVRNVCYLNAHPNEEIHVEPGLYRAVEQIAASGDRTVFLGPVCGIYYDLFVCENDLTARKIDPATSPETAEYLSKMMPYINDPAAISLEALGNGTVRLNISDSYLAVLNEENVPAMDFGWLKNAFIADFLADELTAKGFTDGILSSYDGFCRCLDARAESELTLNLYEESKKGYAVAQVQFHADRVVSTVSLRAFRIYPKDLARMYAYEDGRTTAFFLSPTDGRNHAAVSDLVAYSGSLGCGETVLKLAPIYVSDLLDTPALAALAGDGIDSAYCSGRVIYSTDQGKYVIGVYSDEAGTYQIQKMN